MNIKGFLALTMAFTMLSCCLTPAICQNSRPLALGFGENTRYVLYSDGVVYELPENGEPRDVSVIKLDMSTYGNALLDFEVYGGILYLYAYRSPNATGGLTTLTIYSLDSGEMVYSRVYGFNVRGGTVYGELVSAISASVRGFAVLTANSSYIIMESFIRRGSGFVEGWIYDGRLAMTIYRYNDTLIAAVPVFEQMEGRSYAIPTVVDLLENRTLFSLPALIPVIAFSYPLIQVFRFEGNWTCYTSVLNMQTNSMEFYIVYPMNVRLIEYDEAQPSPYLNYAILQKATGSEIVFSDGISIETKYRLSIIPYGVYMPVNPQNGVLDTNLQEHSALIKTTSQGESKVLYLEGGREEEVYKVPASNSSKTEGFYAALVGKTVYIIDPVAGGLITVKVGESFRTYTLLSVSLVGAVVVVIALRRRLMPKLRWRSGRKLRGSSPKDRR